MRNQADRASVLAYIGLGSNLDNPLNHVQTAIMELAAIPHTQLLQSSSFYRSPPMISAENPQPQPDYINAVAAVNTRLPARTLLNHMLRIEQQHGRSRGLRWSPRTLDLDLLLYGVENFSEPGLTVPHPGLPKRAFVLYPLHEIAPNLEVPGCGAVALLKDRCQPGTIYKI
ncbi:MAG TPA: 2-amino-4-hydroxy-6-hydroxymethyldihydropteridine diphosphokinase [Gammaproteobacteria bacterium]